MVCPDLEIAVSLFFSPGTAFYVIDLAILIIQTAYLFF